MVMSRKKKKLNGKSKDPNSRNNTEERKKRAWKSTSRDSRESPIKIE